MERTDGRGDGVLRTGAAGRGGPALGARPPALRHPLQGARDAHRARLGAGRAGAGPAIEGVPPGPQPPEAGGSVPVGVRASAAGSVVGTRVASTLSTRRPSTSITSKRQFSHTATSPV